MPNQALSQLSRLLRGSLRLGPRGERAARRYLQSRGYLIIAANWRCRAGELDLVALNGRCVVFVEVKSRISHPGSPYDPFGRIDSVKQRRIVALSKHFMRSHWPRLGIRGEIAWRYDTIAVLFGRGGLAMLRPRVLHREGAFT